MSMQFEHIGYNDIPESMRDLLDELYQPEGVEIWWNSASTLLDQYSAAQLWSSELGRQKVQMVIDMLVSGSYA